MYLNALRLLLRADLHGVNARFIADVAIDADAIAGGAAKEPVNGHAVALAGDVPQGLVNAGDDGRLNGSTAVKRAAVNGLPVVCNAARVLSD